MIIKIRTFTIFLLCFYLSLASCTRLENHNSENLVLNESITTNEKIIEEIIIENDNFSSQPGSPFAIENSEKEDCPYECCMSPNYKKKICQSGEYCEDNNCIKYECTTNLNCNNKEYCYEYECVNLSCGSNEYANDHKCIENECADNKDCPTQECNDDHICKPVKKQCVNHICEIIEPICGEYDTKHWRYCWINNETTDSEHLEERIKECGAELIDFDPGEYNFTIKSLYIFDVCEMGVVNAFFESYSDSIDESEVSDYYTIKIKNELTMQVITITSTRKNLENLKEGRINEDEFFDSALRSTHEFIPDPHFINRVNW